MDTNNYLKNVLWHYKATGAGQTVVMDNIFAEGTVGGSFYQTDLGWVCTGEMSLTSNGKLQFTIWLDDTMTSEIEGVKNGDKFKLLIYENDQWMEIIPTKVQTIQGLINYDDNTFKAKAWNPMIIPKISYIQKIPTDITPVVNPNLLINLPEIIGPQSYAYDDTMRKVIIKNILSWCDFDSLEKVNIPNNWIVSRVGKTYDISVMIYKPYTLPEGTNSKIIVKARPFNADLEIITKTIELIKT